MDTEKALKALIMISDDMEKDAREFDGKPLKALIMISDDMEKDAREFDGKPFNGKTVAEYNGNQGAAIAALANNLKELIKTLDSHLILD